jgi:GT2 family glycosyltransferase
LPDTQLLNAPWIANTPTVAVVLINWNGWRDTLPCLDALAQQDFPALHILVVDNASTDDSVARIRAAHPHTTLLESGSNLGFGRGCNVGIRHALAHGADFVWLLNNDTLPPPDTCAKLVAKAHATPHAGLIGSVLRYLHDPTQIQAWGGGRINLWLGRSTHFTTPTPLGPHSYLTFASVLLPRGVIERVGILYEAIFMYWEDADLSLRIARAGYTLAVAEDTAILHKEGGSGTRRSPTIDRYATAAGLHCLRRNAPIPAISMALFAANKFLSRVLRGHIANANAVLQGITDYRRQHRNLHTDQL